MRIAIASTAIVAALVSIDPAHACRCTPLPTPLEELAGSDAVFSGTVTAFVLDGSGPIPVRSVKFEVTACWKGGIGSLVEVHTNDSEAACGRHFTVGVEYLVYASGTNASLHTHLCDRTRRLASAQEDLDALGPPLCTTPVAPSTWSHIKHLYQ